MPEVRQAFAEELVDDTRIGLDEVDPDAPRSPRGYKPPTGERLYEWFCQRNAPIDAIAECSGWICFRDEDEDCQQWNNDEDADLAPEDHDYPGNVIDLPPQPYIAPPKIGRNDPCPCGSGKKYKKCCGGN